MKKLALLLIIICLTLASCAPPPALELPIGKFEVSQQLMDSIEDDHGNSLAAAEGNTLLVVYMTPAKDTVVSEDDAYAYFNSGTQAVVEGQSYDLKCMAFEVEGGKLRYGLVFEIADLGYENKQPSVQLNPPASAPEKTPEPTATPAPAPNPTIAEPIETTQPADASPTASTETSS